MVLHDVKDAQDLKNMRLTRMKQQAEKVEVQLTMLIVAAQFGDKPSLDLTDYTSIYKKSINPFPVKSGSDAAQHFKELKKAYKIEEDASKKKFQSVNKVQFLDNGYHVLVNVRAEAYNGATDAIFKLLGFKILNKDPSIIKKMSIKQQVKVTSLIKAIESRNSFDTSKNKSELERIRDVIRSGSTIESANKKQKLDSKGNSQEETASSGATQENTPPDNKYLNLSPFPLNPIFGPPDQMSTQIPALTQIFDEFSYSQNGEEESVEISEEHSIERDSKPSIQAAVEHNIISLDTSDNEITQSQSQLQRGKKVFIKKEESVEISDDEVAETQESFQSAQMENKMAHYESSFLKPPNEQNEEANEDQDEVIDAIGQFFDAKSFQVDEGPVLFTGYILGTEPLNFQLIGKPFNSITINTTNFRLFLTNFPPHRLRNHRVNENCIAIEFSSKDQILTFFGYDNIEEACKDHDKLQQNLKELLNKKTKMDFLVQRRSYGITRGRKLVFELTNTINELLSQ